MRILAIQLKRIGDLILTTPALRTVREAHPQASITLIVDAACAGLRPVLDMVDEVLVYERGSVNAVLWARIAKGGYNFALDFTGSDRSSGLMLLSRARRRIGFERNRKPGMRGLACGEWVRSSVRELHTVDHMLDLVQPVAGALRRTELCLRAPEAVRSRVDKLLAAHGVGKSFAILHPGTARPEKYWVAERWARVAEALHAMDMQVVVTGGSSHEERVHLAHLQVAVHVPVTNLAGKSDLAELLSLISRASIVLCVDSAALHLAAAAGTPVVALFGPTNPRHWRPQHGLCRILAADGKDGMRKAPMELIDEERVLAAVREVCSISERRDQC